MGPNQFKGLVKDRIKAGIERAIYVEGPPGCGKTELVEQVAKELKMGFRVVHAPLLQPEDYSFPVVSKEKDNVSFIVSKEKFPMEGSDCEKTGILLIDELPQSDNSAQKILANLIQARTIHEEKLKKGWFIVATGNRTTDRAGANRVLTHLKNRMTAVPLHVSLDDWTNWALDHDVKTEVIAFIRFRPNLLNNFDPQSEVNATPRAWAQGVSAQLGVIDPELELTVFSGDVGEAAAAEFLGFLKIYRNLPDPDAIITDPKKAKIPTELNVLFALCGALSHRTTEDNFKQIMAYVERLPEEFGALYVRDAIRKNKELTGTKDFIKWAAGPGTKLLR